MSYLNSEEKKLKILQQVKEQELMDRLRQQKSLMTLNRHCWVQIVSDDEYAGKLGEWISDTNRMLYFLQSLRQASDSDHEK